MKPGRPHKRVPLPVSNVLAFGTFITALGCTGVVGNSQTGPSGHPGSGGSNGSGGGSGSGGQMGSNGTGGGSGSGSSSGSGSGGLLDDVTSVVGGLTG